MVELREQRDVYSEAFARLDSEPLPGQALLRPIRARAFERFRELGFPTTRHEDWRFTNVAPIARTPFGFAAPDGALSRRAGWIDDWALGIDGPRLVFVNGRLAPSEAATDGLPGGVVAAGLGDIAERRPELVAPHLARHARYDEHAFTALNTGLMADGAFVGVPEGVSLETPIHLIFFAAPPREGDPVAIHPRNLIVVGRSSRATIIESYIGVGEGVYFTNAVTELVAGENASIDHYKVGRESTAAFHVGATQLTQERSSSASSHTLTLGGGLVRNNIATVLDGEGSTCTLNGLYLLGGRQHVDNHLRVEHNQPHCDSREFFKGILEGSSRAVFTGRIVVAPDAQKTDAKQTNMNLLLSGGAQVDTKPQLEIFADDVKCTHGATIGQLEEDAIFYLRTRGIPEAAARDLLVYAFAAESLDQVRPEPLRQALRQMVIDRLPGGGMLRETL